MSSRLARNAAISASRRATSRPSLALRLGRRNNSSTSHGSPSNSSDKPWIIGSALVFGPAFLYLISPSARKKEHGAHDDKHDFPGHQPKEQHSEPAPMTMKDDEGTEANVASSVQLSEVADSPKDAQSPEQRAEVATASESSDESTVTPGEESKSELPSDEQAKIEKTPEEAPETNSNEGKKKSGDFQGEGEEGPTDMGVAREAQKSGVTPKEKTEEKSD